MDILIYYGLRAIAGVIVFTLFEYCKVVVTTLQGDNTPKQKGKILPNPLKFVEPIGFLIYVFTGYGWSNPAETSPFMYKNRKVGNLLTYGSPIVLCIILGKILALISGIIPNAVAVVSLAKAFVSIGVFNIIPVYPMAGSWILRNFISPNSAMKYSQYEKIILMVLSFALIANYLVVPLNAIVSAILGL
jgi:Zn-dependent protease